MKRKPEDDFKRQLRKRQIGRLALRKEGNWWVAYWALPTTMAGALELARINVNVVTTDEQRERYRLVLQECVADILENIFGKRPTWPNKPVPAPESERSGSA
jgi:hypothetical protein